MISQNKYKDTSKRYCNDQVNDKSTVFYDNTRSFEWDHVINVIITIKGSNLYIRSIFIRVGGYLFTLT